MAHKSTFMKDVPGEKTKINEFKEIHLIEINDSPNHLSSLSDQNFVVLEPSKFAKLTREIPMKFGKITLVSACLALALFTVLELNDLRNHVVLDETVPEAHLSNLPPASSVDFAHEVNLNKAPAKEKVPSKSAPALKFPILAILITVLLIASVYIATVYVFGSNKTILLTRKHFWGYELSKLPLASTTQFWDQKIWGTYRPAVYFGLKAKHVDSPFLGLMWYRQPERNESVNDIQLRHWCADVNPVEYMWNDHDGKSFGSQRIKDGELTFRTNWFNTVGNSCLASVDVDRRRNDVQNDANNNEISEDGRKDSYGFIFYFATQENMTEFKPTYILKDDELKIIEWNSEFFGKISLSLKARNTKAARISYTFQRVDPFLDMENVNTKVASELDRSPDGRVEFKNTGRELNTTNFVALQVLVEDSENLVIKLRANDEELPETFAEEFEARQKAFRAKFNEEFPAKNIEKPESYAEIARYALSNLLGGIGFWHGYMPIRLEDGGVGKYGPLDLISAVPSRPKFPRGFLWDEGFHQLLVRQIDQELSLEIMGAWLDTMNEQGWIPREQPIGNESSAGFGPMFYTKMNVANPPMFFYLIEKCMKNQKIWHKFAPKIRHFYPRLKQLYVWLKQTQAGPRPGTSQWQGRIDITWDELNPATLPSGFDDYPRATHPTHDEYHLDLRCWMAMSSRVLYELAKYAGDTSWIKDIEQDVNEFNDLTTLDQLHWSESKQQYCDWGLHSDNVTLEKERTKNGSIVVVRKVWEEPRRRLVENVNGYANLFPFLMKMLPPDSPKLEPLLKSLNDTEDFWTPYGLRSLSKRGPYYMAWNTEMSYPYWRGPIWINMNYFALDALQHYAKESRRYGAFCAEVYRELRLNVVRNIAKQYKETGFFWEHFNDETGAGEGAHPFTGWTTLYVLMLSEKYD